VSSLAGVGIGLAACNWLEATAPAASPVASLAAMENAPSVTLPPGEARTLAVQALDEHGAPLNGVTILFVRGEPHVVDFETVDASTASLPLTTETQTALGLETDGVAQARIRMAVDAPARETEVYAFASTSAGADASTSRLFVRFHVNVTASEPTDAGEAGSLDGGADE